MATDKTSIYFDLLLQRIKRPSLFYFVESCLTGPLRDWLAPLFPICYINASSKSRTSQNSKPILAVFSVLYGEPVIYSFIGCFSADKRWLVSRRYQNKSRYFRELCNDDNERSFFGWGLVWRQE